MAEAANFLFGDQGTNGLLQLLTARVLERLEEISVNHVVAYVQPFT